MSTTMTPKKLVYGVGVNDSPTPVHWYDAAGKQHAERSYSMWQGMLERSYSPALHARSPSYINCSVVPEWLRLSGFRKWLAEQNDAPGLQLDKDLLYPGNKVYGPSTCVLVSQALNNLLTDRAAARGEHPIGVNWHKQSGRFQARVSESGHRRNLGLFTDPMHAHHAWQLRKAALIERAAREPGIDPRIRAALELRTRWLFLSWIAGLETTDLHKPPVLPVEFEHIEHIGEQMAIAQ